MSERRTPRRNRPFAGALAVAMLAGFAALASMALPADAQSAPPGATVPRGGGSSAATPPPAIRLMVFSFQHQRAGEALPTIRQLLSAQGSVALDAAANTLAVRDTPASLARISRVVRTIDHLRQSVQIEVQLIHAEVATISPVLPSVHIDPDLVSRLRQLFRYEQFTLLAGSRIDTHEGEAVVYEMGNGYRLSFELGTVIEGRRLRLANFHMRRSQPGKAEQDLVRTAVNLGLGQPFILGLTNDESANRALMLVLRYQSPGAPAAAAATE